MTRLAADTPRALLIPTAQGGVSLEWITDQDHVDAFSWRKDPENLSIEFTPEGAIEVDEELVAQCCASARPASVERVAGSVSQTA